MSKLTVKLGVVHRWMGLSLGLLWIVQALTGSLLVFEPELQRTQLPALQQGPMASLTRIVDHAASAAGTGIERVRALDRQRDLLGADYRDRNGVWHLILIEAATGRPLETFARDPRVPDRNNIWRWIYTLHTTILGGRPGEVLIGISGIVLLSSVAMGLSVGWPRRGMWKPALNVRRWRTASQKLYGWHRVIGLVFAVMLLAMPLTGIYMVFQTSIDSALAKVIPFRLPYAASPVHAIPAVQVSPEAAYVIAHGLFPAARFESIALPTPDQPVYVIRLRQPGEARVWIGTTRVVVDPVTGRVLGRYDALRAPLVNRLSDAVYPAHIGEIAGLPGRLLVLLTGLALATLGTVGMTAWWRRTATRRRRRIPVPRTP